THSSTTAGATSPRWSTPTGGPSACATTTGAAWSGSPSAGAGPGRPPGTPRGAGRFAGWGRRASRSPSSGTPRAASWPTTSGRRALPLVDHPLLRLRRGGAGPSGGHPEGVLELRVVGGGAGARRRRPRRGAVAGELRSPRGAVLGHRPGGGADRLFLRRLRQR